MSSGMLSHPPLAQMNVLLGGNTCFTKHLSLTHDKRQEGCVQETKQPPATTLI